MTSTFNCVCNLSLIVFCHRMTPGQKAEVVKVTKKNDKKATTLAIRDGVKDVSMIQVCVKVVCVHRIIQVCVWYVCLCVYV